MKTETGYVAGVNGNLIKVDFDGSVRKNEVGYILVDDKRLKGEVIRINNGEVSMQIYEMTDGIKVGDKVEFTGELMSVDLGPGLLTQVFDGLQNPLPVLAEQCGFFLERGVYLNAIPDKDWDFTPVAKVGDRVKAGDTIGTVPEGLFTHHIMVPFILKGDWEVKSVKKAGKYNVHATIATIANDKGEEKDLTMVFTQPISRASAERWEQ
jgi:V/A-type H+-transporting ATPase subunit A